MSQIIPILTVTSEMQCMDQRHGSKEVPAIANSKRLNVPGLPPDSFPRRAEQAGLAVCPDEKVLRKLLPCNLQNVEAFFLIPCTF